METLTFNSLQLALDSFTCTENWYQHSIVHEMLYTDGVKYFADTTRSHWLIDFIATEYFSLLQKTNFLFLHIHSKDNVCKISVQDGDKTEFASRLLPSLGLIDGNWKLYLHDNVLLLPSEY